MNGSDFRTGKHGHCRKVAIMGWEVFSIKEDLSEWIKCQSRNKMAFIERWPIYFILI